MFAVLEFSVEKLQDPTGILTDETYEFLLYLQVDQEDELYCESGVGIRLIVGVNEEVVKIKQYNFFESGENNPLDFALEEDEEEFLLQFCQNHFSEV